MVEGACHRPPPIPSKDLHGPPDGTGQVLLRHRGALHPRSDPAAGTGAGHAAGGWDVLNKTFEDMQRPSAAGWEKFAGRFHAPHARLLGDAAGQLAAHDVLDVADDARRLLRNMPHGQVKGAVRPHAVRPRARLHPRGAGPVSGPDPQLAGLPARLPGVHAASSASSASSPCSACGASSSLAPRAASPSTPPAPSTTAGSVLRGGLRRGGQHAGVCAHPRPVGQRPDGAEAAHVGDGGRESGRDEHAHPQRAAHPAGSVQETRRENKRLRHELDAIKRRIANLRRDDAPAAPRRQRPAACHARRSRRRRSAAAKPASPRRRSRAKSSATAARPTTNNRADSTTRTTTRGCFPSRSAPTSSARRCSTTAASLARAWRT
jgi:hypothetical protein